MDECGGADSLRTVLAVADGVGEYKLTSMANTGKILVSMTSYPGRIKNVGIAIFMVLTKQTLPPDEVHLWLTKTQFPGGEHSLPADLQSILKSPKVFLHWTEKDTYCHKRHGIFHIADPEDLVFVIDDDTYYDSKLIETVVAKHKQYPKAIISYNRASKHCYKGKHMLYPISPSGGPYINVGRINGNSMFPVKVVPKEIYAIENEPIRDKCTPICDESWITPWLVYYDVPIIWLNFGWGTEIDPVHIQMSTGLVSQTHKVESNGLERRDNWLAAVLDAFPEIKQKYVNLFNYSK